MTDWAKLVAFTNCGRPFRGLSVDHDVPVMELVANEHSRRLHELWLGLPQHPCLLHAIDRWGSTSLLLRYAAINCSRAPGDHTTALLAKWGAQIADMYLVALIGPVPNKELARFAAPFVTIDIGEHARIGFHGTGKWIDAMAPEVRKSWPACDERALVHTVGTLMNKILGEITDPLLRPVIHRCRDNKPARRYPDLEAVRNELMKLAGIAHVRDLVRSDGLQTWLHIETGIGWLQVYRPDRALTSFERALAGDSDREIAQWGRDTANAKLLEMAAVGAHRRRTPAVTAASGTIVVADGYQSDVASTRARAHLDAGELGHAVDYANRALAVDANSIDALVVLVKAQLARREYAAALTVADRLVWLAADDAHHHYLRGKALLALGRLPDARDAFDFACTLKPTLIEAMLLRREVDRSMGALRKQAGSQAPVTIDIPPSLAELRDVLLGGRPADMIAALSAPRYTDDADAQLVLARLLVIGRELDRALAIYDRLALMLDPIRYNALVGKAMVLLEQGKLESSLALFDLVCGEQPTDAEPSEGRARVLEALGRTGEAAAEYRRFISLATSGANLRVRAAQRPGNRNDPIHYRGSIVDTLCRSHGRVLADGGYRGVPELVIPRFRSNRIVRDARWRRHRHRRARVEHAIARLKNWRVLRDHRRRGPNLQTTLQAITVLHNLHIDIRDNS